MGGTARNAVWMLFVFVSSCSLSNIHIDRYIDMFLKEVLRLYPVRRCRGVDESPRILITCPLKVAPGFGREIETPVTV